MVALLCWTVSFAKTISEYFKRKYADPTLERKRGTISAMNHVSKPLPNPLQDNTIQNSEFM